MAIAQDLLAQFPEGHFGAEKIQAALSG